MLSSCSLPLANTVLAKPLDEAGQEKGEEGAAEGEAPRHTSFIRGDGALFAAGIAAGLFHFPPSQTRCAGDEAILRVGRRPNTAAPRTLEVTGGERRSGRSKAQQQQHLTPGIPDRAQSAL